MCMYNHVKYKTTWMVILTWHCSHNIRPSGGSQLNALISFSGRYGGGRCSYLQQPRYESNTVVPVVAATSKCLAQKSFSFIPTNKQPQIHFFLSPRKHQPHVPKCPGWNQSPGLRVLSTVQRGPTGVPVRKRTHKFSPMQQKGTCVDRGAVFQIVIAVTM